MLDSYQLRGCLAGLSAAVLRRMACLRVQMLVCVWCACVVNMCVCVCVQRTGAWTWGNKRAERLLFAHKYTIQSYYLTTHTTHFLHEVQHVQIQIRCRHGAVVRTLALHTWTNAHAQSRAAVRILTLHTWTNAHIDIAHTDKRSRSDDSCSAHIDIAHMDKRLRSDDSCSAHIDIAHMDKRSRSDKSCSAHNDTAHMDKRSH